MHWYEGTPPNLYNAFISKIINYVVLPVYKSQVV